MRKEVNVVIKFNSGIVENSFEQCEDAWNFAYQTVKAARNRRRLADRETVTEAYYYGETVTGARYAGMLYINGAPITPENKELYKQAFPVRFASLEAWTRRSAP